MAIFQWKGIDGKEVSSGEIEALNTNDATKKLKAKNIIVTNIVLISGKEVHDAESGKTTPSNGEVKLNRKIGKKIKNKVLLIFTKKFSTMVKAGLPIIKTLKMLKDQSRDPRFKSIVAGILKDVEAGNPLCDSFAKYPEAFDTVYINLLKAGETSGKLQLFLEKLVIQIEKSEKIRNKVKGALRYPIILLTVAFAVIMIMLIKVVPVFQKMFASMGHGLPAPTQLIVDISEFFRDPAGGGVLFGSAITLFFIARYLVKNNINVRRKFDRGMLKLPIIGEILQKSTLSKIAMVEGNLAAAGVSVLDSLDIVSNSITNLTYKDAFTFIKNGIASGNSISSLYKACDIFPPEFSQMLSVGEETGNMDEMFESTARYFEEEFDMSVESLTEMLEPIMIVFMGLTVGFIIVAMYMPIFDMGKMV